MKAWIALCLVVGLAAFIGGVHVRPAVALNYCSVDGALTNNSDIWDGTDSGDFCSGGGGPDLMYGHGGADDLYGDSGGDIVEGNTGYDDIHGGSGADTLRGGDGEDEIWDVDGSVNNVIRCGPDFDVAHVDFDVSRQLADDVAGCEKVYYNNIP